MAEKFPGSVPPIFHKINGPRAPHKRGGAGGGGGISNGVCFALTHKGIRAQRPPPPLTGQGVYLLAPPFSDRGCPLICALFAFSHSALIGTIFWGPGGAHLFGHCPHQGHCPLIRGGGFNFFRTAGNSDALPQTLAFCACASRPCPNMLASSPA